MRSVINWGFASSGMNAGAPPCGSGSVVVDIAQDEGRVFNWDRDYGQSLVFSSWSSLRDGRALGSSRRNEAVPRMTKPNTELVIWRGMAGYNITSYPKGERCPRAFWGVAWTHLYSHSNHTLRLLGIDYASIKEIMYLHDS